MNIIKKSFSYGHHTITFETGRIARQASGAVLVTMGETSILVTVVGRKYASDRDFFPLTVNYQERTYAAGRIPGGYFKREGRPSERETLICRLIDRPIRPLFPKGFSNEVQVVATVMSLDPTTSPDIPALLGTFAALSISGIPFNGPLAAARIAYINGAYLLNPSSDELATSELNLVMAGTKDAILMVESETSGLDEETMLGALLFGQEQMQTAITAINEFAAEVNTPIWDWQAPAKNEPLLAQIQEITGSALGEAYRIADKQQRNERIASLRDELVEQLCDITKTECPLAEEVLTLFHDLEKTTVRDRIFAGEPRIDGRDLTTVRPITIEARTLPRTHGSALFTRGETQALVVTTLGTEKDAQLIDALEGEFRDSFMLHYNFPPYCVGETGMMGSPKRREIGHGRLARRAIEAVLPDTKTFPYTLRVVSEVTESNGSSSMATVCGTSLSLMDAGVPIKAPVAGIAMGLIKEGDKFAILTDIMGDEDHLGDMDFKVAGTATGITALQMDIKIDGITKEILAKALEQAKIARLHILSIMDQTLAAPRDEVSLYAPRITTIKIAQDKIRDVIGKGGATIRSLTEETGTSIDIEPDGTIKIAAVDEDAAKEALKRIKLLTEEVEVGKIYEGKVEELRDFGAFVTILPGKNGLVHISQIANRRIENINDVLSTGDSVTVKVLEIDRQGRVRLSMKAALEETSTNE